MLGLGELRDEISESILPVELIISTPDLTNPEIGWILKHPKQQLLRRNVIFASETKILHNGGLESEGPNYGGA